MFVFPPSPFGADPRTETVRLRQRQDSCSRRTQRVLHLQQVWITHTHIIYAYLRIYCVKEQKKKRNKTQLMMKYREFTRNSPLQSLVSYDWSLRLRRTLHVVINSKNKEIYGRFLCVLQVLFTSIARGYGGRCRYAQYSHESVSHVTAKTCRYYSYVHTSNINRIRRNTAVASSKHHIFAFPTKALQAWRPSSCHILV